MNKKNNGTKKIRLLSVYTRDGKGVEKGEDTTPNLKYFFKLFWRKFTKLLSVTLIMDIQVLPILISLFLYFFASPTTPTAYYTEFPLLYGIQQFGTDAANAVNATNMSAQFGLPAYNTYVYWVIGILMAFHVITYGWQKCASTYIMRGLVRGDSVFILSDYFYAIKKNWKQGLILGILDCSIIGILCVDFMFFYSSEPSAFTNFMYAMTFALILLYVVFRFYIYMLIVTFNIKITKAIKNALIFTIVGLKRNILALLGLGVVTALAVGMVLLLLPVGVGVTVILPLLYYLGVSAFIYNYAAYPVIKKYMIDPPTTNS